LLGERSAQDLELGELLGLAVEEAGGRERPQLVPDRVPAHPQLARDHA
jgi:hypothetical protein